MKPLGRTARRRLGWLVAVLCALGLAWALTREPATPPRPAGFGSVTNWPAIWRAACAVKRRDALFLLTHGLSAFDGRGVITGLAWLTRPGGRTAYKEARIVRQEDGSDRCILIMATRRGDFVAIISVANPADNPSSVYEQLNSASTVQTIGAPPTKANGSR